MSASNFDNALNDCIDMLAAGADIRQCLAAHPEHAAELAPLLRVASATMRASQAIAPDAAAKAHGLARMNAALAAKPRRTRRRFALPRLFVRPLSGPIMAAFGLVFLTIVAAGGTTVAASDSVPGERLYWVKSARENVEMRMARGDASKAQTHARLARERGREMGALISRGRVQDAELVVVRMQRHLAESANYVGVALPTHAAELPLRYIDRQRLPVANALRRTLAHDEAYVREHLSAHLSALLALAPERDTPRVWQLIHRSDLGYRIVIVALEEHCGTPHYDFGNRESRRHHHGERHRD